MIEGPKLNEEQYTLLMADGETGHVLTINGKVCTNENGAVYLVLNNIRIVYEYISESQRLDDTINFTIYDYRHKVIDYKPAQNECKRRP